MPRFLALALIAAAGMLWAQEPSTPTAPAPEPPRVLVPPAPPAHARRSLDSPTELARDFAEVVAYLDAGQAYFRAYQKGTHSVEENRAFLAFLEVYEKEYAVAKKEADALRTWVKERGALQ